LRKDPQSHRWIQGKTKKPFDGVVFECGDKNPKLECGCNSEKGHVVIEVFQMYSEIRKAVEFF
jgi:hypothetical protein